MKDLECPKITRMNQYGQLYVSNREHHDEKCKCGHIAVRRYENEAVCILCYYARKAVKK